MHAAPKQAGQAAEILHGLSGGLIASALLLAGGAAVGVLIGRLPLLMTITLFAAVPALLLTFFRPDLALTLLFCSIVLLTDGTAEPFADYFILPDPDIVQGLPSASITFLLALFGITMARTLFLEKRSLPVSLRGLVIYSVILILSLLASLLKGNDRILLRVDFMNMLFPVFCFYLCVTILNSRKRIEHLLTAMLTVASLKACILSVYYLAGRGWHYGTSRTATMDSADLLVYITLILIVFYLLVRMKIQGLRAVLAAAACLPMLFVVIFSYRRAQWVGLVLSMGLMYLGGEKSVRRRIAVALTITLCTAAAGATMAGLGAGKAAVIAEHFSSIFDKNQSSNRYHLLESQQVLRDLSRSPLLGLGLGSHHSPLGLYEKDLVPTNVVHNTFLYVWMKTGLPGLVFFLWAAFLYGRNILRVRKQCLQNEWDLLLPLAASSGLWLAMFLTGPVPWYYHQTFLLALFAAMGATLIQQAVMNARKQPESLA